MPSKCTPCLQALLTHLIMKKLNLDCQPFPLHRTTGSLTSWESILKVINVCRFGGLTRLTSQCSWDKETHFTFFLKKICLLKKDFIFSLCVCIHVHIRVCLFGAYGGQKRAFGPLKLKLYRVVSSLMGGRNPSRVLCKRNKCL